ncbi:hypothetical protein LBMAG53_33020 [Planctomycetota bacterium]|nr:hypothetical protein LBMAG53_33020 [Planctomycetota bacterium]
MSIAAFRYEFERYVAIIEQAFDQLDDAQLLKQPFPGGTSVTGLLTHASSFLTARFADLLSVDSNNRPWRDHQADLASTKSRAIVRSEWEVALATVRGELARLRDSDLGAPLRLGSHDPQPTLAEGLSRFGSHIAYHAGQIVSAARAILGSAWKPLAAKPLRQPLEHHLVTGAHGPIGVAVARPTGAGPHPAVIIGQEGLGVTGHLLGLAHRFAQAGYLAVVPDLYSRDLARRNLHETEVLAYLPLARNADPAAAIAALPERQQAAARRVVGWFAGRDTAAYAGDFAATLAWTGQRSDVRAQHLGAIGFSFGGGLVAQLAASGAPLAAAVVVYGQLPSAAQAAGLKAPVLGHFAGEDQAINANIPAFAEAVASRGGSFAHTIHPGTKHGFFSETRPVFDAAASERVWQSVLGFYATHLQARKAATAAASVVAEKR